MTLKTYSEENHRSYSVQIFNAAIREGLLKENPVTKIEKFEGEDEDPKILTPEQVSRLLEVACPETKPRYAIAAFAGMRWSEIEQLAGKRVGERNYRYGGNGENGFSARDRNNACARRLPLAVPRSNRLRTPPDL